jgi:hypothetical protein
MLNVPCLFVCWQMTSISMSTIFLCYDFVTPGPGPAVTWTMWLSFDRGARFGVSYSGILLGFVVSGIGSHLLVGSTFLVLLVPLVILWCKSTLGKYFPQFFPRRVIMNSWGQRAPTLFIGTLNPVVVRQLIAQERQASGLWDTKSVSYEVQPTNSHNEQKVIETYKNVKREENMYVI